MRMHTLVTIAIACFAGCQHHVRLDPPRPGITPEERVALFWRMRPTQDGFVKQNGELVNRIMYLGDERASSPQIEVVSPEDLEPLVGSDSETMRYARASVAERNKARITGWTGIAAFVLGGVASGFLVDLPVGSEVQWTGVGLMVAGVILAYPISKHYAREELELRARAFDVYTRDLGLKLDVCARGTQVVPCEAPLPEPAVVPAVPPAPPGPSAMLRMR